MAALAPSKKDEVVTVHDNVITVGEGLSGHAHETLGDCLPIQSLDLDCVAFLEGAGVGLHSNA
jgi:hypothetical protein